MSAKSHVDLCLFIQILEVEEDLIPPPLRQALLRRDRKEVEKIMTVMANENNKDARYMFVSENTNLHESIHLVQSVIYPFLRWFSISNVQTMFDLFTELGKRNEFERYVAIGSWQSPQFMLLDLDYYIWDLTKRNWFGRIKPALGITLSDELPKDEKGKPLKRLNVTDLIENAASLIQYKISSKNDFPSWKEFSRWSKRNPAYTGVLEFVGSFIEDEDLAIRAFLDLVQVAFETNRPVQAFAILLAALKINLQNGNLANFVSQPDPCRWIELFDRYLEMGPLESPEYGDLMSRKFFRLERFNTSHFRIGGKLSHPIVGEFARRWGKLEESDTAYRYAFTAPNGYRRQIQSIAELFTAPITLLKFTINGENSVFVTGDMSMTGLANIEGAALAENDIKAAFVDFLAIYGVVRRTVNALMDDDFRLCHHVDCPSYGINLCNTWTFIPKDHSDCTFEDRLAYLYAGYGARKSESRIDFVNLDGGENGILGR
jgi:hypothetical protein